MSSGIELPNYLRIQRSIFKDKRGTFSKIFSCKYTKNIQLSPAEVFYSSSARGVLRGMHLQVGKYMQQKLVTCIKGEVLDVIVNLNPRSPNYNTPFVTLLNEASEFSVLCPPGYAHGFYTFSRESIIQYIVDQPYSPQHDTGVHWSSINYCWPIVFDQLLLSERDESLVHIDDFIFDP